MLTDIILSICSSTFSIVAVTRSNVTSPKCSVDPTFHTTLRGRAQFKCSTAGNSSEITHQISGSTHVPTVCYRAQRQFGESVTEHRQQPNLHKLSLTQILQKCLTCRTQHAAQGPDSSTPTPRTHDRTWRVRTALCRCWIRPVLTEHLKSRTLFSNAENSFFSAALLFF